MYQLVTQELLKITGRLQWILMLQDKGHRPEIQIFLLYLKQSKFTKMTALDGRRDRRI